VAKAPPAAPTAAVAVVLAQGGEITDRQPGGGLGDEIDDHVADLTRAATAGRGARRTGLAGDERDQSGQQPQPVPLVQAVIGEPPEQLGQPAVGRRRHR
jgi:hypothetical protein